MGNPGGVDVVAVCVLLCLMEAALIGAVEVTVGLEVVLNCNAQSADEATRLSWWSPDNDMLTMDYDRRTVDDRFSVQRVYPRERNLQIGNVRTTDAGVYRCQLRATSLATVRLVVNVPPSIANISRDVRKHAGNDVILQCDATGNPQPEVTWYKVTGDAEKEVSQGGSLSLNSLTRFDAGVYSCHADNGVPPAVSKRVRLDVIFGPVLALPYRKMQQAVDTDALLTCLVHAFPPAELRWERAGDVRLPTTGNEKYRVQNWTVDEYSVLFSLHISSMTQSDYGTYFCAARNDFGTDKAPLQLVYALNSGATSLPVMDCQSSRDKVLVGVIVVMATLLAVAIATLAVTLYKWRTAAAANRTVLKTSQTIDVPDAETKSPAAATDVENKNSQPTATSRPTRGDKTTRSVGNSSTKNTKL